MESENIYRRMQDLFSGMSKKFSLMEDPIDVAVQMNYFETSFRVREKNFNEAEAIAQRDELFDPNVALEKKKILLTQIANVPSPEAYRTLENYADEPDNELKDWAKMALQENKLLLESHLLDDNSTQVFISTGLGGKGHKLRYFVVLFNKEGSDLKPFQQKVLKDEINYALQRHDSELEKLEFMQRYTTMSVVVPLSSDLTKVFREGIEECNQFGGFLSTDFIVTNMKELSNEEIDEAFSIHHPITDDDFPPVE